MRGTWALSLVRGGFHGPLWPVGMTEFMQYPMNLLVALVKQQHGFNDHDKKHSLLFLAQNVRIWPTAIHNSSRNRLFRPCCRSADLPQDAAMLEFNPDRRQ